MRTLRLRNFKPFEDTNTIEIAPITVIIGPNSSGKSSLIQPILMLKQTVESRDTNNPLVVNGTYAKLSSFESFIYNHDLKREFDIGFSFETFSPRIRSEGLANIDASFIYNKSNKRIELNLMKIEFLNEYLKLERIKLKKGIRYQATTRLNTEREGENQEIIIQRVRPYKFCGYRLSPTDRRQEKYQKAYRFSFMLRSMIEDYLEGINYIGPLRELPKNLYISGGELRKDVGLKGEYFPDVLWSQSQRAKNKYNLLKKVNTWVKYFGLGYEVKLKTLGKHSGFFQILITNPDTKIDAPIVDVGFGVSQVLPLIVEGFYSGPGSTLLVEQPEIHLHPKVQADIGDLLIELISDSRRIIIETHSEHLISRLTRRVAEGQKISSNDLAIYYISTGKEGNKVEKIRINKYGQFENWPEGFFEEDYAEAVIHSKLIAEKIKEEKGTTDG